MSKRETRKTNQARFRASIKRKKARRFKQNASLLDQLVQKPDESKCILCDKPADLVGVWRPDEKKNIGTKTYLVCRSCLSKENFEASIASKFGGVACPAPEEMTTTGSIPTLVNASGPGSAVSSTD